MEILIAKKLKGEMSLFGSSLRLYFSIIKKIIKLPQKIQPSYLTELANANNIDVNIILFFSGIRSI